MWISQSNLNAGNKHLIAGYFKHFFTNNHVNFYSVEQLNFKRDTIDFLVSLPWALRNKTVHNEEFTFNVKSLNCLSISLFCCTETQLIFWFSFLGRLEIKQSIMKNLPLM